MPPVVKKQTAMTTAAPTRTYKSNGPAATGSIIDRIAPLSFDVEQGIQMLLYGRSGSGKTTFWATFPGPILAMICSGGLRSGELRSVDTPEGRQKIQQVAVESSADFRELIAYASEGHFGTVVLDHASGFADLILKEVLGLKELPAQKSWGMASQQAYGQMSGSCKDLFRAMLNLQCNTVIVAQERNFNEESESELIKPTVGAGLTPSLTGWLNPACDYVVQTFIRPRMEAFTSKVGGKEITTYKRGRGVEYCLRTEAHDVYMTKFRIPKGQPMPDVIVDPTYEKVMQLIRGEG